MTMNFFLFELQGVIPDISAGWDEYLLGRTRDGR